MSSKIVVFFFPGDVMRVAGEQGLRVLVPTRALYRPPFDSSGSLSPILSPSVDCPLPFDECPLPITTCATIFSNSHQFSHDICIPSAPGTHSLSSEFSVKTMKTRRINVIELPMQRALGMNVLHSWHYC